MSFERVCVRCGRVCFSVEEWQNHECFDMAAKLDAEIAFHQRASRPHTYVLIGQTPVPEPDAMKWAFWMGSADRVVFQEHIGSALVSTVFLGLDHNHFGEGPPLLFETMIFADGDSIELMDRCSTWLEAEAQHKAAVETWKKRLEGMRK